MSDKILDDKRYNLILKIVTGILARDESFAPDDIDKNKNLLEWYGLDSLTFIDKAMALEEYFNIDIDDGQIEELLTADKIVKFIIKTASEDILGKINSDTDVNKTLIKIDPDKNNTSEQIRHILTSSFLSRMQSDLNLQVNSIYILLSKLLRNNKVEHVSSIPKYENDKLSLVHIVFLTRRQLYYISLLNKQIKIREISLTQLSIESKYIFNNEGSILSIEIICDVKDVGETGKPKLYNYSVTADFVDTTIKLLSKIHEYKDKVYEK